jgi:predicted phosphodiesterase
MIQSKIIIIGDSHARGCSQEVKHNLDHRVEVQGIVKPGANIEVIVNTSTKNIGKLTKKDIVVVWGGTRDVGKNESEIGLHQIKNFV